jgi:Adenylate and Guanylate cyclase catalytic domain
MFCDLVGSTALSTRHDPEDLRELIGDYHHAVSGTVSRFDGFVAKYMGDGVLIYFGYPQAHEDDAERAVRAGLAVIEAVGRLPARQEVVALFGRIGAWSYSAETPQTLRMFLPHCQLGGLAALARPTEDRVPRRSSSAGSCGGLATHTTMPRAPGMPWLDYGKQMCRSR